MCLYYPYISSVQCVHVCHHQFLDFLARHKLHAEYKTNCTFMKMTRGTNLMQQLWFIIINYSTCFGHLLPIFRSAGCVLLHVVFSTRCCGCGPKEPVCSLVHCVCVCIRRSRIQTHTHTVHKTTHQLLRTTATTPNAEHYMQQYTACTPEDGHIDVRNM